MDYPHKDQRGTVTGQLVLNDPQAASTKLPHLTVGLAHPDYTSSAGGFVQRVGQWQHRSPGTHDGNYYQFWTDGTEDGKFTITNVRPGTYTLHAFADGVLGEFAKTNITVDAGKSVDLGKLDWQPVRYGKQIWEIGYPDRTGDKFYKGDAANYWLWGWPVRYGDLFPNDITYTIGKSDYHKDWFFEQVPHEASKAWKNPAAKDALNQPFGWMQTATPGDRTCGGPSATAARPPGPSSSTWTKPDKARPPCAWRWPAPTATAAWRSPSTAERAAAIRPVATNALRYNTNKGVWREYTQKFDAALLKPGENQMQLTVPAGERHLRRRVRLPAPRTPGELTPNSEV